MSPPPERDLEHLHPDSAPELLRDDSLPGGDWSPAFTMTPSAPSGMSPAGWACFYHTPISFHHTCHFGAHIRSLLLFIPIILLLMYHNLFIHFLFQGSCGTHKLRTFELSR